MRRSGQGAAVQSQPGVRLPPSLSPSLSLSPPLSLSLSPLLAFGEQQQCRVRACLRVRCLEGRSIARSVTWWCAAGLTVRLRSAFRSAPLDQAVGGATVDGFKRYTTGRARGWGGPATIGISALWLFGTTPIPPVSPQDLCRPIMADKGNG